MQTAVNAHSDVVDTLMGERGQHEQQSWMKRDAWVYGGGRERAKVGREEGRVEYENAPALRDN